MGNSRSSEPTTKKTFLRKHAKKLRNVWKMEGECVLECVLEEVSLVDQGRLSCKVLQDNFP